jgi:cell division transport system ATP-binding protein
VRVANYAVQTMRGDDLPKLRRKLGIVFQDFRLLEDRSASENVAFALEVTGARRDTIPARVMRVLTQVGLAAKAAGLPARALRRRAAAGGDRARAGERSRDPGGRRTRRATWTNAPPVACSSCSGEINTSGTIVVMATHDLDLVRQTTYRTIEMREGAVVYDSAADEKPDELT